jgi:hypothetical protein
MENNRLSASAQVVEERVVFAIYRLADDVEE